MKLRVFSTTLALVLGVGALPATVHAEQDVRKSPLDGAPAVRRRAELRAQRFELGAGVGSTLGQDFHHAVLVNARLSYHLTDWLAISGMVGHNLTPDLKTTLTDELDKRLGAATPGDRSPPKEEALGGLNKIAQVWAVQGEIVPFTGKYSLFGKAFLDYDFYAFGGLGGINYKADGPACVSMAPAAGQSHSPSCPETGMRLGPTFGFGTHSFINRFVSIDVELRDIYLRNNVAGRDTNGDMRVNSRDLSWNHNFIVSLSVSVFFPTNPAISD